MGYDAFISYSHAADSQLAPRLQDGLQRLAKPWYQRRALHVFRDDTGLTANPGLWSSIETAMDDSSWFVFLASAEAAASPWVKRELGHWIERNGTDRLLPVVTGGTWIWDAQRNDFDLARSTAVPAVLAGVFAEEPRHVDMTWAHSEDQVDLRNGRFRDQVAEIAAPVRGMAKEDLEGADVREHRRTLRWAWGAAAALLLLTASSVIAGLFAMHNADEAAAQRDEASLQRIAAEKNATEAELQKQAADDKTKEANEQRDIAEDKTKEANEQRDIAEDKTKEANEQRDIAEDKTKEANRQRGIADDQTKEANKQTEEANRQRGIADNQRSIAVEQSDLAKSKAEEALENLDEANLQKGIAQVNEKKANDEKAKATKETARAIASERRTAQALESEKQAKAAEVAARKTADQQRSAAQAAQAEAVTAQKKAEAAAAAEARAREAESDARKSAETEALASASSAQARQDGALSLLLGVEAARRGSEPAAAAGALPATSLLNRPGNAIRVPFRAPDSTAGRRALFEAVTAAQGGTDSYRVDRYLPFPADLTDPPFLLWRPVVSPNGRYMAAAESAEPYRGLRGSTPTRVFVWDLESPTPAVKVLSGHTEQVATLAFAGTGETLVTQDVPFEFEVSPTTRIWDVTTGEQMMERSAQMFVDPTAQHIALQAILPGEVEGTVRGEVEFVDARTATTTAIQPGWLAVSRPYGIKDTAFIETPFSSDGRYAYGQSAGRAVLWDLNTGGRIPIPLASPRAMRTSTPRVSPDGSGLAVAVENGTNLALFDSATGTPLGSSTVSAGEIKSLTWNADGTRLAILDDQSRLAVIDLDLDGRSGTWSTTVWPGEVTLDHSGGEVTFDHSGDLLTVTIPVRKKLSTYVTAVFEVSTGRYIGTFDGELAATTTDASRMFFLRNDGTLAIGSSADGHAIGMDDPSDSTAVITASADGRYLAASNQAGVRVWDLTGDRPPVNTAATTTLTMGMGLAFVPGTTKLIGIHNGSSAMVWDLARIGAGSRVGFAPPDATVLSDGETILEPIDDRTGIRFRNLRTGVTRPGPALQQGESVAYLLAGPEGAPLVANLANSTAVVANSDGSVIGRVPGTVAAVSRDGSRLAVRRPGRVIEVLDSADLSTEKSIPLAALPEDDIEAQVDSVALDPTGARLAATNATGTTVVWDTGTGDVITTIEGTSVDRISFPLWGLGFSPDGNRLVVKSPSNTVRMYATGTTANWEVLATQLLALEFAGRVVFSPDGALVAIDGLFILDGETLQPITTLLSSPGAVTRFTADGRSLVTLASAPMEGPDVFREVTEWTVSTEELTTEACRIAARNLTDDEWKRYMGGSGVPYRKTCT